MPTHDYIISNGTGAAVRSDINSALSAIVSLNSSASEPATMYAYQLWADTALNLLKIRNSANNAWITLRQLDGDFSIVAVEDGLLASPSLTFTNDLNTGIFRPGNDSLAIVTGGTRKLLIDANGGLTIDLGDADIYGVRVGRGGSAVSSNTAVGSLALNANTIGAFNTAVGKDALTLNVGGIDNTAMGSSALGGNTSGTGNTAIGLQSLFTNSTANYNTALGLGALFTNNAANNTAVGVAALKLNSSGANNTALGTIALENSTLGSNNICIGYNSGNSLTTGSNNTIIGGITGTAGLADTVIIGAGTAIRLLITSGGLVGIGTTNPGSSLQVNSSNANIATFSSTSSAVLTSQSDAVVIGRSEIDVVQNTTTNLVQGYFGSIVLIGVNNVTGDDVQFTFVVVYGWNAATVLFSNTYGATAPTFTFTALNGVLQVSHNSNGTVKFRISTMLGGD